MKNVQRILLWLVMLSKRLYKKPTFLLILVLIPVLVLGYASISAGSSGMLTIGLAQQGEDPLAQQIMLELHNDGQLMAFQIYESPEEAEELLRAGKLDAVWIFPDDMAAKIAEFAYQPTSSNAFITVIEREDNVALFMTREKLSGAIYPQLSQQIYLKFMRELAPELDHLSDQELLSYYENIQMTNQLFIFEGAAAQQKNQSYLLSPLRGILGTLILLCALATAMYYIRDSQTGTFAWVSQRWRFLPELGCQLVSTVNVCGISLICLALCGLSGNLWMELLLLILYSLCAAAFAMTMRRLCGSVKVLGTILPLLMVITLVVCPVFLDLGQLRQLQYLLPPTYYISAVHNSSYIGTMMLYTLAVFGVYYLAGKCLRRE